MDWKTCTDKKEKYQLYLQSREWAELRNKVRERANGICERCKVNLADAVHHLTYARKYNEQLSDLQAICEGCHSFIHGHSDSDPRLIWWRGTLREDLNSQDKVSVFFDAFMAGAMWAKGYRFELVEDALRSKCFSPKGDLVWEDASLAPLLLLLDHQIKAFVDNKMKWLQD